MCISGYDKSLASFNRAHSKSGIEKCSLRVKQGIMSSKLHDHFLHMVPVGTGSSRWDQPHDCMA